MSKHTKGPWSVHQVPDRPETYGHHVTSDGQTVCAVTYQLPDKNGETERIANARLIAAAPDLLEALQCLVDASNPETTGWDEAVKAIAKATGEPQ